MAIETLRPGMARGARLRRRGRERSVTIAELRVVTGRSSPRHLGTRAPSRCSRRKRICLAHPSHMAGGTTLPGVAGPACAGGLSHLVRVTIHKVGRSMS